MASELVLRSGHVAIVLDRDVSALILSCDHHRVDQALPLHWPNVDSLMRDFLDRHTDCQEAHSHDDVGAVLLRGAIARAARRG